MTDTKTLSRRTLVKAGVGALAAPAVLRVLPAQAQSQLIKIGHVSPKTGPLAGFGETQQAAASVPNLRKERRLSSVSLSFA